MVASVPSKHLVRVQIPYLAPTFLKKKERIQCAVRCSNYFIMEWLDWVVRINILLIGENAKINFLSDTQIENFVEKNLRIIFSINHTVKIFVIMIFAITIGSKQKILTFIMKKKSHCGNIIILNILGIMNLSLAAKNRGSDTKKIIWESKKRAAQQKQN